ncbi:hypothetical protein MNB_SUP05-SYMBIONT-5-1099 [hydrothermal vent metagenome]|uniref:Uncharacterized protein n=1 Tax=hydrothermal vent metagenome TaxID=652676 RepID=A0A1W1E3W4_9ZZZZ
MKEEKFNKKYQSIFNKFKDDEKTSGYDLIWIDEIYLPFWFCSQEVIVEKNVQVDKFSRILLELIDNGIKKHSDICGFLGIKDDDFTLMQLNFLISNDFLEDNHNSYEITYSGREFLKENSKILQETETIEFNYVVNDLEALTKDKFKYFYNDLLQEFFDKDKLIDAQKEFKGYKTQQTNKLNNRLKIIPHKNKPILSKMQKVDFISFFNSVYKEGSLYDYGSSKIKAHKKSILFLILIFENENGEKKIEIRHCKGSVNSFINEILENKLSKETERYVRDKSSFLENLQNTTKQ